MTVTASTSSPNCGPTTMARPSRCSTEQAPRPALPIGARPVPISYPNFSLFRCSHESFTPIGSPWLHADRVVGGDRHHRHPHRPAAAGRPEGPGGGRPDAVYAQPGADRDGDPHTP